MSNLLFMDESNGNGVYATSATAILINNTNINNNNNNNNTNNNNSIGRGNSNHSNSNNNTPPATSTYNKSNNYNNNNNNSNINNSGNNIQSLMAAASNAAGTAACSSGGVIPPQLPTSLSNEDLSQSLSEYTDADESISAPTEFLAEFLSSVMLKDYKKALKYCKLILQYEPHNSTAKEFYPLILDKLRDATSSDSDENYNKSSSSPELILEPPSSDPSAGESDEQEALAGEEKLHRQHIRRPHLPDDLRLAEGILDPNSNVSSNSNSIEDDIDVGDEEEEEEEGAGGVLSSGSVGVSLSDSVDGDDDDDDDDGDCEDADDDDDPEDDDDDDIMSSSGDDLPVDEHQVIVGDVLDIENSGNACGGAEGVDGVALNGSNSSRNSSSGGKISSRSDNTTHSYSSLLLEEEDDIVPANLHFPKDFNTPDLDVSN
ncbi:probable WRKY transcription factor protein 1, partial [Musca vetustissima]|uniref:probable WRKY transcription factor protein 1 n=1 Tax=Musca vetustissima TaxID=27455 RepID=UPI002AB74179